MGDYDLKELKERQKQKLRQKAMKKGLDPEALTGKYPPKIRMYSKYERRTDTRTYEDRRKLYEGGWEVVRAEHLQALRKKRRKKKRKRRRKKRRKNKCFLKFLLHYFFFPPSLHPSHKHHQHHHMIAAIK